jgi:hypothetical protein
MDTDPEAFIRWALDDARTLEERYTTELLVEHADQSWHNLHKTGRVTPFDKFLKRIRERFLNPAYQPAYSENSVRHAAEIVPLMTSWRLSPSGYERPIRDMAVLRFMPALKELSIDAEIADISLLAELPNLRVLGLGTPLCEDFRPLARCRKLRSLSLSLRVPWPEVAGLESLQQLESLHLRGNLLVFPPGLVFPNVREGALECTPLQARNVGHLPQFPACEFLKLAGVDRLDGIEEFPRLRNLTLTGPVRDFSPLVALPALTWLNYVGALPLDVAPLARAPALLRAGFQSHHTYGLDKAPARDYAPLAASATLRSVTVTGCPPVDLEVAALNAALPPWDDLFLLPEPRPVPPLRVIIAPDRRHPRPPDTHLRPDEQAPPDVGIRQCEEHWVARHGTAFVSDRMGHADWGEVKAHGTCRRLDAHVECYEDLPRFPQIVEALRALLAGLRSEYLGILYLQLRVRQHPTPAQQELLRHFREKRDEADFEQMQRDEQERQERLRQFQIKQQQGEPIDPAEFSPAPREPLPLPPWKEESDDDDDDDDADDDEGSGNFAVKTKPDPPPDPYDDEHPLADHYRLMLTFTRGEIWLDPRYAGLGLHLLQREADEEMTEEPPASR